MNDFQEASSAEVLYSVVLLLSLLSARFFRQSMFASDLCEEHMYEKREPLSCRG